MTRDMYEELPMSLKTIKTKVHTVTHKALPCRCFAPLGNCLVVIFYSIFFNMLEISLSLFCFLCGSICLKWKQSS